MMQVWVGEMCPTFIHDQILLQRETFWTYELNCMVPKGYLNASLVMERICLSPTRRHGVSQEVIILWKCKYLKLFLRQTSYKK
ncbi:hypothetical protein XENTR_v10001006 [Xenopus tropicalis]|nr:hypothetical protein XENTR_v10001006 [Xenopus tropicalis]